MMMNASKVKVENQKQQRIQFVRRLRIQKQGWNVGVEENGGLNWKNTLKEKFKEETM